jgi:hypothetical protein
LINLKCEVVAMSDVLKLGWKDWVLGGIAGGLAGFAVGYCLKVPYTKWRVRSGFDARHMIHHSGVGTSIAMLGQLAGENLMKPVVTGFGIGLAAEDYVGHLAPHIVPQPSYEAFRPGEDDGEVLVEGTYDTDVPSPDIEDEDDTMDVYDAFNPGAVENGDITDSIVQLTSMAYDDEVLPTKTWKQVSDWPPQLRNAQMTSIIRDIILEDAHDPIVRATAENVMIQCGLDGHDHESICRYFHQYILDNCRYINDEAKGPSGEATDRYAHSYITLPPGPQNPLGRGLGDCDDLVIAYLSMCQSVGVDEVCGLLIDQSGKGYNHIMAAYVPDGRTPKQVDDVIPIELTEDKPFGWMPPCRKVGFLIL